MYVCIHTYIYTYTYMYTPYIQLLGVRCQLPFLACPKLEALRDSAGRLGTTKYTENS